LASQINASNSGFGGIVSTGDSSGVLQLQAAGTTIATIQSTGMAVTGTLSSSGVSTFAAGTAALPAITTTGDTNTGIWFPAADTIAFAEGGAESMRIDSSGNVGIGTTSPNAKLQTNSGNGSGTITKHIQLQSDAGEDNVTLRIAGTPYTGNTQASIDFNINAGTNFQSYMAFGTSAGSGVVERMRINSSGKLVMASTTDGLIGSIQAGITANTASTNAIIISAATANGPYPIGARGESTNQGLVGFFNSSDTAIASITKSGNSVAYNTSSDYRLKENITPMTGALSKVLLLKPVTYTWKEDGLTGQGFIAHELQAVVPDAVTGEKDAVETYTDKDGIEQTRIKPQGIDTSKLVATLTAAIQEQQTIINDLKARIETLEAK
jgi:hypothetical protein